MLVLVLYTYAFECELKATKNKYFGLVGVIC